MEALLQVLLSIDEALIAGDVNTGIKRTHEAIAIVNKGIENDAK